jgi:uncharacterized membrane protein YfcA
LTLLGFALGVLAGAAAGLGLGGSALLVPVLVFALGVPQLAAQTAGLYGFIPAAAVSTYINYREKRINIRGLLLLALPGVLTVFGGAQLAFLLSGAALRIVFGAFLLIFGVVLFISGIKKPKREA